VQFWGISLSLAIANSVFLNQSMSSIESGAIQAVMEGDKSRFLEELGGGGEGGGVVCSRECYFGDTHFGGGWRISSSVEFWNEEERLLIVGGVACG